MTEAQDEEELLSIGIAVKKTRFEEFVKRGIFGRDTGFEAAWVDLNSASSTWPTLHVLLHKVSDAADKQGLAGLDKAIGNIKQYQGRVQSCAVVDDCDLVSQVFSRVRLCQLLDHLRIERDGTLLCAPHYVQVQAMQKADELKQLARLSGVRLPCIAKSASACGTTDAHQMSILTQWSQMDQLRIPDEAILQNFHNHGGVLYKVYVIGEKVHIVEKQSLPDITCNEDDDSQQAIHFDSLDPLAYPSDSKSHNGGDGQHANHPLINDAAIWLLKHLRLTLFGFDVIITDTGVHYVVDVNYFPSFKEISSVRQDIAAALKRLHTPSL